MELDLPRHSTHVYDMEMTAPPRRLCSTSNRGVKEVRVRFRPGGKIET
jgi:hypothetical protein